MKKLLLVVIVGICIVSCSTDDKPKDDTPFKYQPWIDKDTTEVIGN